MQFQPNLQLKCLGNHQKIWRCTHLPYLHPCHSRLLILAWIIWKWIHYLSFSMSVSLPFFLSVPCYFNFTIQISKYMLLKWLKFKNTNYYQTVTFYKWFTTKIILQKLKLEYASGPKVVTGNILNPYLNPEVWVSVLLLFQLPAYAFPWRQQAVFKIFVPTSHTEEPSWVPGWQFCPGPILASVAIWKLKE